MRKGITRRKLFTVAAQSAGGLVLPAALGRGAIANDMEARATDLLIIGAGPFGLALSAQASALGIDHLVVGEPMGFWKDHMPPEMLLRSSCQWSLDPTGVCSIDAYLEELRQTCQSVEPLSRNFYLDYARWLQDEKRIEVQDLRIAAIEQHDDALLALATDGARIRARNIVVAVGFERFAFTPPELAAMFPVERVAHTCHLVDFAPLRGKRVVIIGGRQSAFEWAAMIREAGAASVELVYRHDTPLFEPSDWAWVGDIVDSMPEDPGWFRRLSDQQKAQLNRRFWEQGRLRLEPWLWPRVDHDNVRLHPNSNVVSAGTQGEAMSLQLDSGKTLDADQLVFATGYRVDLAQLPFLPAATLGALGLEDGYAPLDIGFQSRVPGLFFTSLAATRDFGSFLAFTVSARAQATIIAEALRRRA